MDLPELPRGDWTRPDTSRFAPLSEDQKSLVQKTLLRIIESEQARIAR